ncbi:DEAD/DEAH box helicase [Canibacter sp. lx-72]|nr:DEAD/DEAH box helicase [Canibacter zhuwentaonis]
MMFNSMNDSDALDFFESQLEYPLDPFQKAACERLLCGNSVLVAAPTGSGKTTVAEFAIMLARHEKNQDVIYTAPIKALSNQKYAELCKRYGADQVALLTGDNTINQDAPIKVMTTEVLRNIIYADVSRLHNLGCVILDEVHYLGDQYRGAVWEEIILHIPQHVLLVGLSATVSNVEELGDWIHTVHGNTEVIISERRPTPLFQHILTRERIYPLHKNGKLNPDLKYLKPLKGKRARGAAPRKKSRGKIAHYDVVEMLNSKDLVPAIVFIFSRAGCDLAVSQCLRAGIDLNTADEKRQILTIAQLAVATLSKDEHRILRINSWLRALEHGIAAHHAGMLPQLKAVVEQLFLRRLVKVVFATETLALGINMPAKAVVLEQLKKFNGVERVYLSSGEYTQLTGRAGRRGLDTEGHAVILWEDSLDLEVVESLAGARSYPVRSSFRPTYNMTVNLLREREISQVRKTLERSFAQFQADRAVVADAAELAAAERSLAAYRKAITDGDDTAAEIWREREKPLRKKVRRLAQRVKSQTNSIAREFERVTQVLTELKYLVPADAENTAGYSQNLRPSVWGLALTRLYGEKALLTVTALKHKLWHRLTPQEFAALIATLTYEPRRGETAAGSYPLSSEWQRAMDETIKLWAGLDAIERAYKLPPTFAPFTYSAWVMDAWANKKSLTQILTESGLSAGDFLRWIKQTADLLGQIAQACETVINSTDADTVNTLNLLTVANLARSARGKIMYGIVESSVA